MVERKDLKLAKSFFDFINVELYTNPERHTPRIGMSYWIWSELNQELQEYKLTEAITWDYLKKFVDKGIVYICTDN